MGKKFSYYPDAWHFNWFHSIRVIWIGRFRIWYGWIWRERERSVWHV